MPVGVGRPALTGRHALQPGFDDRLVDDQLRPALENDKARALFAHGLGELSRPSENEDAKKNLWPRAIDCCGWKRSKWSLRRKCPLRLRKPEPVSACGLAAKARSE